MTQLKQHLWNLHRMPIKMKSRSGYLRLDMNENPSGLPVDFLATALSEFDITQIGTYPEYQLLIEKIAKKNGIGSENVCLANGSDGGIKYLFDAYVSQGDEVLMTDPTFAMYPVYCGMFNSKAIRVPYGQDFAFPFEKFLEAIDKDVRIAVIVNPNNPMGTVIEPDRLYAILNVCKKNGTLLVVDEAYIYFYEGTFIKEILTHDNLIVLRTFSKLCGLAGLRIGFLAASARIINGLYKVKSTFDVNAVAVFMADKLLDRPDIIERQLEKIHDGKKFLIERLKEKRIEYRDGRANFILIQCGRHWKLVAEGLRKEKILVSGGFAPNFLNEYVRVTLGPIEYMQAFWEAFDRLWPVSNGSEFKEPSA